MALAQFPKKKNLNRAESLKNTISDILLDRILIL